MTRRRSRRLLAVGLVVGLVVLLGITASAARAALSARDRALAAQAGLSGLTSGASRDQLGPQLAEAERQVDRALADLQAPAVRLVARVPLLGRSLVAERTLLVAVRDTLDAAGPAVAAAGRLRRPDGGLDLRVLARLHEDLTASEPEAARSLAAAQRLRTGLTPPPVGRAVRETGARLQQAQDGLRAVAEGARLAEGLLGGQGPRRLLVVIQNNAELRGGGGYASSFATGATAAGRVQVAPLRGFQEVRDGIPDARRVPAPPWFVRDHGTYKADTTLLVNWNMSPHVPAGSAVLAAAAGTVLGAQPDVVVVLDVPALAALTRLTGGVRLPDGRTTSPEELESALLVDAYAEAGASEPAQVQRRAALRAAAGGAVGALFRADLEPLRVVRQVGSLARGRHLTVWSAREDEQRALDRLGLSGALPEDPVDLLSVSLNNLSANKLDQYVRREVRHDAVLERDSALVTQEVVLSNRTPTGLVPYVAGRPYGRLAELVQFDLPTTAELYALEAAGRPVRADVRPGPPRTRVSTVLTLPRSETVRLTLRYRVPLRHGAYRLELVPQPLVDDARLQVRLTAAPGLQLVGDSGIDGAFDVQRTLVARVRTPADDSTVDRVRRFLREPVRLP